MTTTDYVVICTSLFLGIIALVAPALSDEFKRWRLRPKLSISYAPLPPGTFRTPYGARLSPAQVEKSYAYYFRLVIGNTGRTQARRCEIVVEEMWARNKNGVMAILPQFGPVPLIWDSENEQYVDINPTRTVFADFIKIPALPAQAVESQLGVYIDAPNQVATSMGLVLCTRKTSLSQPTRFPDGHYRFKIALFSENADPVRTWADIFWDGHWEWQEWEMYERCVVRVSPAFDKPVLPSMVPAEFYKGSG